LQRQIKLEFMTTPVTKTFFPPINEYMALVQRIYDNEWLTNRGELVKELEERLMHLLGVSNILITNNGTVPIQIAVKLLGNGGEIITTPFSYVATTSSIVWENCTPVFVDIHPEYLTIDESKIEAAITHKTTCILATHVFGNPCNVAAIDAIAKKHGLKVIYDAAHCFGVSHNNTSIFNYGDVSTCSFHATKLFHTGEGGAVFCANEDLRHQIFYSHNFGHKGKIEFHGLGINGKISELQAAMGLAVLPHFDTILQGRKFAVEYYLNNIDLSKYQTLRIRENTDWNYSYFPVIFETEELLLKAEAAMLADDIMPRRYFYPSLNTLPYLTYVDMPVSESVSSRVLCLPLFATITEPQLEKVVKHLNA
jgi:dTDP-4-amino-4,6-dideoxygalactose transaminase